MSSIILKIKELVEKKRIPLIELSEKIGKTRNTLYNYMNNTTVIDVETLQKIADVLEVPVTYFFDGTDTAKSSERENELERELEHYKLVNEFNKLWINSNLEYLFIYANALTSKYFTVCSLVKNVYSNQSLVDTQNINNLVYLFSEIIFDFNVYLKRIENNKSEWWIEIINNLDKKLVDIGFITENETVLTIKDKFSKLIKTNGQL